MSYSKLWVTIVASGLAAGLAGCVDWFDEEHEESDRDPPVGERAVGLTRAASCDDLLMKIHADAIERVDQAAEALRDPDTAGKGTITTVSPVVGIPGVAASGPRAAPASMPTTPGAVPPMTSAPIPPTAPGGNTASDEAGEATQEVAGYSDTNRQVADVDEADIVKVDRDGDDLYLLHGDRLVVMRSRPAEETALDSKLRFVFDGEFDGRPYEMFVEAGRVVVFSAVRDGSAIAGQRSGGTTAAAPRAAPPPGCIGCFYDGSDHSFTKLTFLDMRGSAPEVVRELIVEGSYVSSRRYDSTVRAVISGGFKAPGLFAAAIEYNDPWGDRYPQDIIDEQVDAWRDRAVSSLKRTTLEDWLPVEREVIDGELRPVEPSCADFYIPAPGRAGYGLTSVIATDLARPSRDVSGAFVLGAASTVYSNAETLVLGQAGSFNPQGRTTTVLHAFELDRDDTRYVASGEVAGNVINQFALDERDGVIRVATVEERWDTRAGFATDNRVRTLRATSGKLEQLDETRNLGKPRETIRSVRYVGDRGYVVTFERTDPLVVVDLSDPSALKVLGEVQIPGFSTYMHPIGDDHLLTIGEFVDPQTGGNRTLQLRMFDVSDPTEPRSTHRYEYPLGGASLAQSNHKAFNYFADRQLLSFPYVDYSRGRTSLDVFHVDLDSGFDLLGNIEHQELAANCLEAANRPQGGVDQAAIYRCPNPSVRRGVFIGNYIYSISYGGVLVHDVDTLRTRSGVHDAVARVDLPAPRYADWDGYGSFGGGPIGRPVPPPIVMPPLPTEPPPRPEVDGGASVDDEEAAEFCERFDRICGYGTGFADEEDCREDFAKFDDARRSCVLDSLEDAASDASWCGAAAGNVECAP